MARRGGKRHVTYDSDETKAVLGLAFLFIGIIILLSLFLEGPIFGFAKNLVSDWLVTIVFAVFFFNLSLYMFHSEFPTAKLRSIIGQLLFVIFYSAFLTSIWGAAYDPSHTVQIQYGGWIGFYGYHFLADYLFFNFTPVVLVVGIFIALPLALTMTINQFLDKVGGTIQWVLDLFGGRLGKKPAEGEMATIPEPALAQTIGDLQRNKERLGEPKEMDTKRGEPETIKRVKPSDPNAPKVEVKSESVEGAFINKELNYPDWQGPSTALLNAFKKQKPSQENIKRNADIIEQTLNSFGIKAKVVDVLIGPSVTQYALDIALGTKVSKISNLTNDIALALATQASSVRLEVPIPGTSYIGIEVPNHERETVYLKEMMDDPKMHDKKFLLPLALGKNINGDLVVIDLQKMPHILIAGATGSGKSILTNGFIISLLMTKTPDEVKFIMVDPKQVELSDYNGIPHLITPVITEMDKVVNAMKWAIAEMEARYTIFREAKVRNIEGYNEMMGYAALPYIVIVIDELADMMMTANKIEAESAVVRIAQKARATGIHLILATQRPSVDVITGLIKANIPGRIGMSVTTQIDSRVILDHIGAESLLGRGDMLFKDPSKPKPFRLQGMWVSPEEVQGVVNYIKSQVPEVHYNSSITEYKPTAEEEAKAASAGNAALSEDDQFANAVNVIVNAQKGSASLLQRKLSLGYNRAARLLDEMEELGVVGPANGSKPREVMITDASAFLASLNGPTTEGTESVVSENEPEGDDKI